MGQVSAAAYRQLKQLAVRQRLAGRASFQLTDSDPILLLKPRGRPPAASVKVRTTIRLSPEVIASFRAAGAGWQTRVDAALKEWLATHPAG